MKNKSWALFIIIAAAGVGGLFSLTAQVAKRETLENQSTQVLLCIWDSARQKKIPANMKDETVVLEDTGGEFDGSRTKMHVDPSKVEQLTTFPDPMTKQLVAGIAVQSKATIESYMNTPVLVRQGVFSSSSTYQLAAIDIWGEIYANTMWYNKIKSFAGIKFTTVAMIQLNATPFAQGKLIMSYMPGATETGIYPYWRTSNLMTLTQLPHVLIDANHGSQSTLEIPWISYGVYARPVLPAAMPGAIFLNVYIPFNATGGDTTAEYSIWLSFKDVEVVLPHYRATSGFRNKVKKKGDPIDQEEEQVSGGTISKALKGVATVGDALTDVPLLGSFAGTASWVARGLASTAQYFGFSKPLVFQHHMPVFHDPHAYMPNSDIADNSQSLALCADNKLELMPGIGGTELDEMSINYIIGRYAYYTQLTWNDTDAVGTSLLALNVTPGTFNIAATDNGTTVPTNFAYWTPLGYMARFFQYWRGSIIFKFLIAKTKFHTGRLMVIWNPDNVYADTVTLNTSSLAFRSIYDLCECDEFEFILPYSTVAPWLTTTGYDGTCGALVVYVMNYLRAPANVPGTIKINVEVKAGPDFQFSVPTSNIVRAVYLPTTMQGSFAAQSGVECCRLIMKDNVGGEPIDPDSFDFTKFCIGESVPTIRTLLKRYTFTGLVVGGAAAYAGRPFVISISAQDQATGLVRTDGHFNRDAFSCLAPMFLFNRGGIRLRFVNIDPQSTNSCAVSLLTNGELTNDWTAANTWQATSVPMAQTFWTNVNVNVGFSFEIPAYQSYPLRLNAPDNSNSGVGNVVAPNTYQVSRTGYSITDSTNASVYNVYRSVAEDFQFGMFIGAPTTLR